MLNFFASEIFLNRDNYKIASYFVIAVNLLKAINNRVYNYFSNTIWNNILLDEEGA